MAAPVLRLPRCTESYPTRVGPITFRFPHYLWACPSAKAGVTKRQVSDGTKTDVGRDCRDAFLGLGKTCKKLCVSFWDYLGARLGVTGAPVVPRLADHVRCRGQPA